MAGKGNYERLFTSDGNANSSKYVELYSVAEDNNEQSSGRSIFSKRRKLFLAGFIAVFVISVVTVAAVLGTKSDYFFGSRKVRSSNKITFDDIFSGTFSSRSFSVRWLTDDTFLHSNDDGGIKKFNLTKNASSIYLPQSLIDKHGTTYTLSPDKKWIMFKENSTQLYRHSSYSDYYIGRLSDKVLTKLVLPGNVQERIRYAAWCGSESSMLIVLKNNVYFKHRPWQAGSWYQITTDGIPKSVFNGVPDWVYEEEILSSEHAVDFSEDGKYIVFAKFNSSRVKYYKFTKYGPRSNAYTSIEKIAYPKAGYDNPIVSLYAVDIEEVMRTSGATVNLIPLDVPAKFKSIDHYYYTMKFVTGANSKTKPQVFVSWMNRVQDHTITVYYDLIAKTNKVVEEHKVKGGWVDDDYPKPKFSADGTYFVNLLPKNEGSSGSFRHVAKIRTEAPMSVSFLTSGKFDIHDIVCFDPTNEVVYFRSTETSPADRHVYKVDVKTKKKTCITCDLGKEDGGCKYYYAQFSKQCSWGNFVCYGPGVPHTKIRNMKVKKSALVVETNKNLKKTMESRAIPKRVLYTVPSDGFDLHVEEWRPVNFDKNRKHAVLFSVYGGPGTQSVSNTFGINWEQFLVSNYDIIVVQFDARGSGYYGDKFMHAVYRSLGTYEAKDANTVASYLGKQSYVDKDRISIWGWSYGGFYSAAVLASGKNLFKAAISVAPVTDWRYYDTIYTERYMGLPTKADNLQGYEKTSVLPFAKNFKGRDFLLVHGTGDDNVHAQQSMQLANSLVANKVQFRMQNMKKHFHPLTMQNLERVWKAEQKAKEEAEKLEELQRELEEERRREALQMHAVEQGIVKKKSEKLSWMYAGPQVNHEEYLLGRKIDKNVEILKDDAEEIKDEAPGASFFSDLIANPAKDMADKIKEDPLFLIKKKEDDSKKELIKNPIKLRKLKEMLNLSVDDGSHKRKKNKKDKHRKHKKNKQRSRSHSPERHRKRDESMDNGWEEGLRGKGNSKNRKPRRYSNGGLGSDSSGEEEKAWGKAGESLRRKGVRKRQRGDSSDSEDEIYQHDKVGRSKEWEHRRKYDERRRLGSDNEEDDRSRRRREERKNSRGEMKNDYRGENNDRRERKNGHREEKNGHSEGKNDHRKEKNDHREDKNDHRERKNDHREEKNDHRERKNDRTEMKNDHREEKNGHSEGKSGREDRCGAKKYGLVHAKSRKERTGKDERISDGVSKDSHSGRKIESRSKDKHSHKPSRNSDRDSASDSGPRSYSPTTKSSRYHRETNGRPSDRKSRKRRSSSGADCSNGDEHRRDSVRGKKRHFSSESDSDSDSSSARRIEERSAKIHKKRPPRMISNNISRKMNAEELERKRKEMTENAKWRDDQRSKNVKQYKLEDEKEDDVVQSHFKTFDREKKAKFIHEMQVKSYSSSSLASVEDRIKRNIYTKQRTQSALNKKFTEK
eukprot:gene17331-19064_t